MTTPISNWQSDNNGGAQQGVRQGWYAQQVKSNMSRRQSTGYVGSHAAKSGKHHAPVDASNVLNSTQLGSSPTYVGKHTASGQAFIAHNTKYIDHQTAIAPSVAASQAHVASQIKTSEAKSAKRKAIVQSAGGTVKGHIALGVALSEKHKGHIEKHLKDFVK